MFNSKYGSERKVSSRPDLQIRNSLPGNVAWIQPEALRLPKQQFARPS